MTRCWLALYSTNNQLFVEGIITTILACQWLPLCILAYYTPVQISYTICTEQGRLYHHKLLLNAGLVIRATVAVSRQLLVQILMKRAGTGSHRFPQRFPHPTKVVGSYILPSWSNSSLHFYMFCHPSRIKLQTIQSHGSQHQKQHALISEYDPMQ